VIAKPLIIFSNIHFGLSGHRGERSAKRRLRAKKE